MSAIFPVPLERALDALADDDPIETRFENVPNTGVTLVGKMPRALVVETLRSWSVIEESGPTAQEWDFGIFITCLDPKNGYGNLFFKTKPEARVPREVLLAKERGQ